MLICFLTMLFVNVRAQEYNQAYIDSLIDAKIQPQIAKDSKFLLTGYMSAGIKFTKEASSFGANFSPILLWKPDQRFFVEAELETELEGSETKINLEYIDASYFVNKYLTIRAGKFLSPFGIYQDRLHPQWINKLPSTPLGFNHDDAPVGPTTEIGIDLRGGVPLGSAKMNYSIYLSNGPSLNSSASEISEKGQLNYSSAEDNNKNKTIGGRLGLLPFSNSSFEIGGSFQNGKVGDKGTQYQNIKAQQYALDVTYVNTLEFIKGLFDVKAQWNWVNIDKANYRKPSDSSIYTFNNKRDALFAQAAFRPTMSHNKFLKKTELVFRYSGLNVPTGEADPLKLKFKQYTYGINYWYDWRTVLKFAYQSQNDNNAFYIQLALGF